MRPVPAFEWVQGTDTTFKESPLPSGSFSRLWLETVEHREGESFFRNQGSKARRP